ncbi:MAG TPA: hypothetical protein VF824_12625 [Thermoanaerobaculia bacterium]|jgi:hypothetical protein
MKALRIGPRTVAYILATAYGISAMIWPPVAGARPGAAFGVAALTLFYVIGVARAEDWRRF